MIFVLNDVSPCNLNIKLLQKKKKNIDIDDPNTKHDIKAGKEIRVKYGDERQLSQEGTLLARNMNI